jgi:hypothetical protein
MRRRRELKDPWVKRVQEIFRAGKMGMRSRSKRTDRDFAELIDRACQIRFNDDAMVAAEVEAWILSGGPPAMIAERCHLPVEVIQTYSMLFFDVKPRLDAVGYILHVVIGRPLVEGFSMDDLGSLWKFCAYMRGPHALDVLLFVFPGGKPRPWPSTLPATLAERRALVATCRLMVLTRCLKIRDMSAADRGRLILLSQWFERLDEADFVTCSETGAISQVDVSSLLGSRVEDPDGRIPARSSPQFVPRYLCAGTGGRALSDRITGSGPGVTDLHISTEPSELVRRSIA